MSVVSDQVGEDNLAEEGRDKKVKDLKKKKERFVRLKVTLHVLFPLKDHKCIASMFLFRRVFLVLIVHDANLEVAKSVGRPSWRVM